MDNRKRRGPRSVFGPKSRPNRSHSLTDLAKRILAAQGERYGTNESNLVELMTRTFDWNAPFVGDILAADLEQ